jgi:hypothetical protein
MINLFNQYYTEMVNFVKDSDLNKSHLHDQLADILERIIALYGGDLLLK